MFDGYLLSILVWLPIIGGFLVLFSPDKGVARPLALAVSVLTFLLSIPLWTQFTVGTADMQFVELVPWIEPFKINYHLA
ncbi:MAG: NADH-quinone oxidoreductase subunit M, partial [Cocleimonas sp.]|nr:NADH-quinone oxidoreductase subunit M [Cocleimonas sp.]